MRQATVFGNSGIIFFGHSRVRPPFPSYFMDLMLPFDLFSRRYD